MRALPVPPAGDHGGDGPHVAAAMGVDPSELLDLSVALNPEAPDVAELAAKHVDALERYPDPTGATEVLASTLGVAADRVLLTNGGAEAIALVCSHLGRARVDRCEFSLYARHLEEALATDHPRAPRIRSNPHNPTGRLAGADEHALVWDEAFYPLATGTWSRGTHEEGRIVLGSLTKVFACPGLRLGYVAAAPDLIAALRDRQPHWSVNALALAVLPDLLARADLEGWRDAIASRRRRLARALPGVEESDAPYVLVRAPEGAAALRARLARRGVLVRDCTGFGLPDHVRVAVPDEAGLRRLEGAWRP